MTSIGRKRRSTRLAALIAGGALVLTGCGGNDSADIAAGAPTDSPGAVAGEVPTVPGEDGAVAGQVPAVPGEAPAVPGEAPAAPGEAPADSAGKNSENAGQKPGQKPGQTLGTAGQAQGQAPGEQKAPPITTGTITVDLGAGKTAKYNAVDPIKMVFFNFGSGYTYTEAILKGAQERARQLGVQLDVKDAKVNPVQQANQMQTAITSNQYVGGFVLPISSDILCDIGTNLAPKHNFSLVVTNFPICGRRSNEGQALWAPGSLAFDSADQELSDWNVWGEYIRAKNPGKQKVILLVGPPTTGGSENADDAFRAMQKKYPEFEIAETIYTDFSQAAAAAQMNAALIKHPDTTIVASIYSETTKATVDTLKRQGKSGKVKVYDVGADSTILPLIQSGEVEMTRPYYPVTMGATAVQAIYDARVGRKPIPRFYDSSGKPKPAMQGNAPMLAVTRENLAQFRAAGLSEY
jgi:ribose transport system substrate-binding protein